MSRVGHVIGNYRLVRLLGQGGVGSVYEVEHVRLGRRRAMKLLHAEVTPELVVRFFNEARAVNAIKHPNVVDIEDFVTTDDGESFTIMDLLEGEDLRGVLRREGKLAPARVARIGEQLAEALAAVHAHGIVHRDLKPENVFLARDGERETAKLLDFGVAKFLNERQGLTRADMTMGTPNYMAPEQIVAGKSVEARSDLYALGMVMYECLTGAAAFAAAGSRAQILRAHCFTVPAPPSEVRGEAVPAVLEAIVMRCLEKAPDDRFSTGTDIARAFAVATPLAVQRISSPAIGGQVTPPLGVASTVLDGASGEASAAPAVARRRTLAWQIVPAVVLLGAAVAVLAWPKSPTAPSCATGSALLAGRCAAPSSDGGSGRLDGSGCGSGCGPASTAAAGSTTTEAREQRPADPAPAFDLVLRSTPPGAQLFRDQRAVGMAPVTLSIPIATTPTTFVARFPDGREVTQTIVPDRSRAELAFTAPPPVKTIPRKTAPVKVDRDATLDPFQQ